MLKKILLTFLIMVCLCASACAEEYKVRAGDVIDINVLNYDELTATYIVRSDGVLVFPLLGEMKVEGMTTTQLAGDLNLKLREYLTEPEVYINILQEGTTRVYLLGEIKSPGMYELKKSRTVIDAITAAGSYTSKTAKKSIYLIRKNKDEEPIKINLEKMLETGDMSQNYELHEGDVLYFKGNGKLF